MNYTQDALGDRMKAYESHYCSSTLVPTLPIYARIDGRCFSNFTRGMDRPYDTRMSALMVETTKYLVEETGACIGYTQSDEISLMWYAKDTKTQPLFGGKVHKLNSVLAAMTTAKFITGAMSVFSEKVMSKLPCFDCRVFNLPTEEEGANAILWRELDARKNSITMLASVYFSHKELHGKTGGEKLTMLAERGVYWSDHPNYFKRGTFVKRIVEDRELTLEELEKIPEKHRPNGLVTRSRVVEINMPPFASVSNKEDVIFRSAKPSVVSELCSE